MTRASAGIFKLCVIESIEQLAAQLQMKALRQSKALQQADIEVVDSGSVKSISSEGAERAERRCYKVLRGQIDSIGPSNIRSDGASQYVRENRDRAAAKRRVNAHGDGVRRAGLKCCDAGQLPAACKKRPMPSQSWNLINPTAHKTLWVIKVSVAFA